LDWTASKVENWMSLSATSGSLAAGASTTVTVSLNANANSLATGNYSDTVGFANTTSGNGSTSRVVSLEVTSTVTPVFAVLTVTESKVFQMVIQGTAGTEVVVEASLDFLNWTPIATNQIGLDGTLTVDDLESAGMPTRFYRMRLSP
jgi:hypothetical protein